MTAVAAPAGRRKSLGHQELLATLARLPIPKDDADYILSFVLAAERRYEERCRRVDREEDELRRFRKELALKAQRAEEGLRQGYAARAEALEKKRGKKLTELHQRLLHVLSKRYLEAYSPEAVAAATRLCGELSEFLKTEPAKYAEAEIAEP